MIEDDLKESDVSLLLEHIYELQHHLQDELERSLDDRQNIDKLHRKVEELEARLEAKPSKTSRGEKAANSKLLLKDSKPFESASIDTAVNQVLHLHSKLWQLKRFYKNQAKEVKFSGLFDECWYKKHFLSNNLKDDPIIHYLSVGWLKGYDPSPNFKTIRYLELNPDVAQSGINPLYHHIKFGKTEDRKIK